MAGEHDDKFTDPFAPPDVPCAVCCLHCGERYESWQIEWRALDDAPFEGAWCCPTPACCAVGYGFDILPAELVEDADDEDDDHAGEAFADDAIWLDVDAWLPARRVLGNVPQPPFDRPTPDGDDDDEARASDDAEFGADDIPF